MDLDQLEIYTSYFHMNLSSSIKESIQNYCGLKKLKREDVLNTECLYIPSDIRNNMTYLLLCDMPYLREYCKRDQSSPLSVNEVSFS